MKWVAAVIELCLAGVIAMLVMWSWNLEGPRWLHVAFTLACSVGIFLLGYFAYDIARD